MNTTQTVALILVSTLAALRAAAEDCSRIQPSAVPQSETIGLVTVRGFPPEVASEALGMWNSCREQGFETPTLVHGQGEVNLTLMYLDLATKPNVCAEISGRLIRIYSHARDPQGKAQRCGRPGLLLAHEIGHFLGLDHPPASVHCERNIMAHIRPRNRSSRRVDGETCRAISRIRAGARAPSAEAVTGIGVTGPHPESTEPKAIDSLEMAKAPASTASGFPGLGGSP